MKKCIQGIIIVITALIVAHMVEPAPSYASDAQVCTHPPKGVLRDWYGGTDTYLVSYYMNTIQIKNTSSTCAYKVGIASYKAYQDYRINVFSQTYFASRTKVLQPGEKWTYTVKIPNCTYQTDVYWGDTLTQFRPPNHTYSGQGRFLDGWYFPGNNEQRGKLPVCQKPSKTPWPAVKSVTITPTPSPTPPPQLPTTGPGPAVALAIGAPIAALLARKYL